MNKGPRSAPSEDYIIIDRLPLSVLAKLLFTRRNKVVHILWLPPRLSTCFGLRPTMIRWNLQMRRSIKKLLSIFFPNIQIDDFDIGRYPKAKDKSGIYGVLVTESLYAYWQSKYPKQFQLLKRIFFSNSDIYYAYKKSLCMIIEDVLYKYFACCAFAKDRKTLLIIKDSENGYYLNYALSDRLINPGSNLESSIPSSRLSVRNLRYVSIAFLVNTVVILTLALKKVFLGRISFRRSSIKLRNLIAFNNRCGTSRGKGAGIESGYWDDNLFLVNDESIRIDDLVILAYNYSPSGAIMYKDDYDLAGVRVIDVRKLKISIWCYLREIVPRSIMCLAYSAMGGLNLERALSVSITPKFLGTLIEWTAVCEQVPLKVYMDYEEHSIPHIIKTVVSKQFGSYTIFLPHGIVHRMCHEIYLCYSAALVPGKHFPLAYGKHWKQDMAIEIVGNMKNDSATLCKQIQSHSSSDAFKAFIEKLRKEGQRIISFFPGSVKKSESYVKERVFLFMKAAARIAERWKNVTVLIKPKPAHYKFFRSKACLDILGSHIDRGLIRIIDGHEDMNSSVQCMALVSDACVSLSASGQSVGSSWIEAMMLGRPSFGYDPEESSLTTPLFDKFHNSLILRTEDDLLDALDQVLNGFWHNPLWKLAQDYFDPYCDGKCMHRIRESILRILSDPEEYLRSQETAASFLTANTKDDTIDQIR